MKTIPVTAMRQNIYKILRHTIKYGEPVQITTKEGNAVVISEDDWEAIQETMYLLSVPNLRESIADSDKTPLEDWGNEEDLGWDIH